MGNNFLYLKVNNNDFFKDGLNPQQNNIVVYVQKDNKNQLFFMAKDQNGNYQKINPTNDIEDSLNNQIQSNKQFKEDIKTILKYIVGTEISGSSESSESTSSISSSNNQNF